MKISKHNNMKFLTMQASDLNTYKVISYLAFIVTWTYLQK